MLRLFFSSQGLHKTDYQKVTKTPRQALKARLGVFVWEKARGA